MPRFDHGKARELRKRLKLTQTEVARRVAQATGRPCRRQHVHEWETETIPGADYLFGLARALCCTPNDLYEDWGTRPMDVAALVEETEKAWGINLRERKLKRPRWSRE